METTDLLSENVLSVMQRRQRSIATKRRQPQLKKARAIAARRLAPEETLIKRARRMARNLLRKKFAGKRGENYSHLSPADRVQVDKMIEKKLPAIERLVKRLLPQVRNAERQRLKNRAKAKSAGRAATRNTKSLVNNKIPLKEMNDVLATAVVDEFVDFLVEADFDQYGQFVPHTVLEDICVDGIILDSHTLNETVDQMTVGYPITEGIDLNPIGLLGESDSQFVTMYNPDKMVYHAERVKLKKGENLEDQPVIAARIKQGYQIRPAKTEKEEQDIQQKAFMKRYRTRVDDE